MKPRAGILAFVLAAALAAALAPHAAARAPASPLALSRVTAAAGPLLAQRSIEREWGPAEEDSLYRVVEMRGWKSPALALGLSAAVPGAGQLYAGERMGWLYLALEAAGWVAYLHYRGAGQDSEEEARAFAGDPRDARSTWTFEEYRRDTGLPTAELEAIFALDSDAFYDRIGRDESLLAGWKGFPPDTRKAYLEIRDRMQDRLRRARVASYAIWLNHLLAAADALRAARIHNIPIERNLELELKAGWKPEGPALTLALEGRF